MGHLIDLLFKPPSMPPIELPLPARLVPGVRTTIARAFELAYYRGVYDGVVAGVLVTLLRRWKTTAVAAKEVRVNNAAFAQSVDATPDEMARLDAAVKGERDA